MKVKSINISTIKSVEYQGKEIKTGIFKQPTNEDVFVTKTNIENDEQADLKNHGGEDKAVYAFSSGHYDFWSNLLGKSELQYGSFGENLTITDLQESEVFIGDQFQIGQCVLEVSQPRVPCFKLGIALANQSAANLFTKSYNTGVYFRVIKEGIISKGHEVVRIKQACNSVSVRDLFQAYFDKSFSDRELVFSIALNLPQLALEWQEKLLKRHNRK